MAEVLAWLYWWLIVSIGGLLIWPLTFRMFGSLADHGYAVTKVSGLLSVGYVFWMLSSLGYLNLTVSAVLISLVFLGIFGLCYWKSGNAFVWMRENVRYVLITETVFLITFGIWAYIRCLNPDISGTEKPMEFAFMNSILRGGAMPPEDPWLSGYAISYYYFGYVIMAVITRVSGVSASVGFNLGLALLFGLTAVSIFGLTYNLISRTVSSELFSSRRHNGRHMPSPVSGALMAPIFALVSGNLNGLLEVLHQRGLGAGRFWQWLDIKWTDAAPVASELWIPERYLWWWQASRVIRDRNIDGSLMSLEPITEFPLFSFLLGDLHPHVLALPFVILAMSIALQLYLGNSSVDARLIEASPGVKDNLLPVALDRIVFFGLVLGGLSFLNTWDYPIYLFVAVAGYLIGRNRVRFSDISVIFAIVIVSILLYWPFYLGFQSQAAGVLPNVIYPTRVSQFIVMFGVLLVPVVGWLIWEISMTYTSINWKFGSYFGVSILMFLLISCGALVLLTYSQPEWSGVYSSNLGALTGKEAISSIIRRRIIESPWTSVLLTLILVICASIVANIMSQSRKWLSVRPFVLLLLSTGCLLTLVPEFLFLRDSFSARMNTIFKFYYQAWIMWSIVAAYGIWRVSYYGRSNMVRTYLAIVYIVLIGGLIYSFLSVWTKTQGLRGTTMIDGNRVISLNGTAYLEETNRFDYEAIKWINHFLSNYGVIVEAIGGSYSEYARISTHTGLSTVLGWPGHELQWRGGYDESVGRESAIDTLYSTRDWSVASDIMSRYAVKYVYIGHLERRDFPVHGLSKFEDNMKKIYSNEMVEIYERY